MTPRRDQQVSTLALYVVESWCNVELRWNIVVSLKINIFQKEKNVEKWIYLMEKVYMYF